MFNSACARGSVVVIEMNPRVSRSSALASKATGYPIAKIAALLAVGYTLDELTNDITTSTPASFEPTIDYIVTKMPRFTFEKFGMTEPVLGTQMKSVGEAMAIGRTFAESLQKAMRSLEIGRMGLDPIFTGTRDEHLESLRKVSPDRLWLIADAFRAGISLTEIQEITAYDPWFLNEIEGIVEAEKLVGKLSLSRIDEATLRGQKNGLLRCASRRPASRDRGCCACEADDAQCEAGLQTGRYLCC